MAITVNFHDDLASLLRRQWRHQPQLKLAATRTASIKDVVESFGLPHTEVGRLLVDGREVAFHYLINTSCHIDIWPITPPWDVLQPCFLRPHPLPHLHFLVDINVGKLGRLLRMAGFDAASHPDLDDTELAACAEAEGRLLLSKNRALLMRKNIHFGRIIRATAPPQQLHEVLNLLNLHGQMQPLSRCLECNTHLEQVAKEEIDHLLEPLTRKYYQEFSRCPACAHLYWPGSHVKKMLALLARDLTA
ncbi:MAG: Mut7-C ubiquitin/RNAse domain-containing protein [Proteobacteria bacterium]|nr:Mut7-C ubiquitin/RNAse domain-containing protein [Pseudomonadota bacterium]MBU1639899.1 Mut7-C ubiquitin/RNAse domain-containing protein [Pseudomonadota bacterium]